MSRPRRTSPSRQRTQHELLNVPDSAIVGERWDSSGDGVVVDGTGKSSDGSPPRRSIRAMHPRAHSPRTSGGAAMQMRLIDRGFTQAELDMNKMADTDPANRMYDDRGFPIGDTLGSDRVKRVRDPDDYPKQYSVEVSGRLDNASGNLCAMAILLLRPCTVLNTGEKFLFRGDWLFQPSSRSQTVRVPDDHYMWFGWWSQQSISAPTTPLEFRANYGGKNFSDGCQWGHRGSSTTRGGGRAICDLSAPR